MNLLYLNL